MINSSMEKTFLVRFESLTKEVDHLFKNLFPICRSITGAGVRKSLNILKEIAPFEIKEIPSGTVCHDWVIPDEWDIQEAYIEDSRGKRILDFRENNLHVVNYSKPIYTVLHFSELDKHLHTLPDMPEAIPYRTSYYNGDWGFCLSKNQYDAMNRNETYRVRIDAALFPGSLTYGEALIEGNSKEEYLISTYCCHPSLGNDNLSGIVMWALLLRELQSRKCRHSYRFIIIPETIGAIAYLWKNEKAMHNISGGFVITCVAGPGPIGYKETFLGNHIIDRIAHRTLLESGISYEKYPFDINGSDERQFSSPFYRIPIGTLCKSKYYDYPEYHTSLDNLQFVSAESLINMLSIYCNVIQNIEMNLTYKSLHPFCEPFLSKRGLYPTLGGSIKQMANDLSTDHANREYSIFENNNIFGNQLDAINWLMFLSDGEKSLIDIAEQTVSFPIKQLFEAAETLRQNNLLELVI